MLPHAGGDAAPVAGLWSCGGLMLGEALQMSPPNLRWGGEGWLCRKAFAKWGWVHAVGGSCPSVPAAASPGLAWLVCGAAGVSRGWPWYGVTLLLGTGPVHGVELHPNEHEEEMGGHKGWKRGQPIHSWRGHPFPMTLSLPT